MILFFNILAWVGLVLSALRIIAATFWHDQDEVQMAERMGMNPLGDAIARAGFVFIVCLAWLIARHFSR